jgi:NAD(P)-dependent dehydrogenase (short-subunit alcohol dehydrogenase family)
MTAFVVAGDHAALGEVEAHLRSASASGRAAQPRDIAAAALFLAGDESWYMNGHCMVLDGTNEVLSDKALPYFQIQPALVREPRH